MPVLAVSDAERNVLEEILVHERETLADEIHHTDAQSLRRELLKRREVVAQVIDRLQMAPVG